MNSNIRSWKRLFDRILDLEAEVVRIAERGAALNLDMEIDLPPGTAFPGTEFVIARYLGMAADDRFDDVDLMVRELLIGQVGN